MPRRLLLFFIGTVAVQWQIMKEVQTRDRYKAQFFVRFRFTIRPYLEFQAGYHVMSYTNEMIYYKRLTFSQVFFALSEGTCIHHPRRHLCRFRPPRPLRSRDVFSLEHNVQNSPFQLWQLRLCGERNAKRPCTQISVGGNFPLSHGEVLMLPNADSGQLIRQLAVATRCSNSYISLQARCIHTYMYKAASQYQGAGRH